MIVGGGVYIQEIIIPIVSFLCFLPAFINEIINGSYEDYYLLYIQMSLSSGFFFYVQMRLMAENNNNLNYINIIFIFTLIFIVALGALSFLLSGGTRGGVIFGPNIMYRIYASLGVICYYFLVLKRNRNFMMKSLVVLLVVTGCISTGSRGGVVMIAYFVAYVISIELYINKVKLVSVFKMFLSASTVVLAMIIVSINFNYRAFYFNINNASEASRLEYFNIFFYDYRFNDFYQAAFGSGSGNGVFVFNYPHNIFLESLVWGGVYSFIFVIIAFIYHVYNFMFGRLSARVMSALALVIGVGSQISGSLYDNYLVLSLFFSSVGVSLFERSVRRRRLQAVGGPGVHNLGSFHIKAQPSAQSL